MLALQRPSVCPSVMQSAFVVGGGGGGLAHSHAAQYAVVCSGNVLNLSTYRSLDHRRQTDRRTDGRNDISGDRKHRHDNAVFVESALDVTLPAFAAGRRRACSTWLSIDISCPRGAQQQTHRLPSLLTIDGTDRRTD